MISLNSQKKENVSKVKTLRNSSQLKEQNSHEAANNETDICSLTDTEFKREVVKILKDLRPDTKELRADMSSNADSFRKELENITMNIEKIENSFAGVPVVAKQKRI